MTGSVETAWYDPSCDPNGQMLIGQTAYPASMALMAQLFTAKIGNVQGEFNEKKFAGLQKTKKKVQGSEKKVCGAAKKKKKESLGQ